MSAKELPVSIPASPPTLQPRRRSVRSPSPEEYPLTQGREHWTPPSYTSSPSSPVYSPLSPRRLGACDDDQQSYVPDPCRDAPESPPTPEGFYRFMRPVAFRDAVQFTTSLMSSPDNTFTYDPLPGQDAPIKVTRSEPWPIPLRRSRRIAAAMGEGCSKSLSPTRLVF